MESQSCILSPLQYPSVSFSVPDVHFVEELDTGARDWCKGTAQDFKLASAQRQENHEQNLSVLGQTNSCCQLVERFLKIKYFGIIKCIPPHFFWLFICLCFVCLLVLLFAFFPQRISQETLCLALSQFPCCGPHSVSVCLASDASVLRLEGWKVKMALYYQTFSFICAAFKHRDSVGSLGKGCWGN